MRLSGYSGGMVSLVSSRGLWMMNLGLRTFFRVLPWLRRECVDIECGVRLWWMVLGLCGLGVGVEWPWCHQEEA